MWAPVVAGFLICAARVGVSAFASPGTTLLGAASRLSPRRGRNAVQMFAKREPEVDWDSELKKLSKGEIGGERPKGLDGVTDFDVASYKAQKQLKQSIKAARKNVPRWKQVQSDPKLLLGIVVGVSFLFAVLSSIPKEQLVV